MCKRQVIWISPAPLVRKSCVIHTPSGKHCLLGNLIKTSVDRADHISIYLSIYLYIYEGSICLERSRYSNGDLI